MKEKSLKISKKELRMIKINEKDINGLDFRCDDEELNNFIHNESLGHLYENLAVTYLCKYEGKVVGFVSISTSSVKINPDHRKKMKFSYPQFPSVKIGRLAVDNRYEKMGIGSFMIGWTIGKSIESSFTIGIRFVSLDAYEDSILFYKKNNFCLYVTNKRNKPMYVDLMKY